LTYNFTITFANLLPTDATRGESEIVINAIELKKPVELFQIRPLDINKEKITDAINPQQSIKLSS